MKILAIDDNKDSHTIIKALIKDSFPDSLTITALTGLEGLELAFAEDPDVILLDIIMPGFDGFDVCKKLKADEILRDIPVVFLTSLKGEKETRIHALEAGGDAFLAKPIDEIELTAQIRAMVKIKNANSEKRNEKRKLASLVEEQVIEIKKTQTATLNILEDITRENEARKKSETALRESEEKFRTITEQTTDLIALSDINGMITYASPSSMTLFQVPPEEMAGHFFTEFLSESDIPRAMTVFRVMVEGKEIIKDHEFLMKRKDGSFFIGELSGSNFRAGDQYGALVIIHDITGRKQTEEKVRQAQIFLQASIESPKDMIILSIDKNYQYLYFNTVHKNTIQSAYGKDVKTGMNLLDCMTNDDDRRKAKINYDLALNGTSHVTIEEYGDFERCYYETRYNPIYNDNKEIIGATAFSSDITNRIQAELTIRESERRFREMLENVDLVAISLDTNGNITFCNDYCLKLTGWKPEEVMGRNWFEFFIPPESEIENIFFASILNGQMPVHLDNEIVTRDGKLRLISWNNTMLRDLSGAVIGTSSIGVDITERKESEVKILGQLDELQRWQEVTLGRVDRNRQLKHEVNELLVRLGETIRYPSQKSNISDPFQ